MKRVCIVEDEESLREMLVLNLQMEDFDVVALSTGTAAMQLFNENLNFDLIILDVMLPGYNGVELCKRIRQDSLVPILFLSAKGTTTDRIEGLKAGGNDYLPKPFDLEELLLRIAVLTNSSRQDTESLSIGPCEINFKTYVVHNKENDSYVDLSKREIELLKLFNENAGQVVSRNEILDKIWGTDQFPTTRTIDNYILNFRKIFEVNPREPRYFHSIRGVGYKFTP